MLCLFFLTLNGASKEELKKEIEKRFYYDLNEPIEKTRQWYTFDVSCQMSVPVAIRAYLDSSDFEDAVRLAVSVGGDSDTIGDMTGAIAEAAYGVPKEIADKVKELMTEDVAKVYDYFVLRTQ